MSVVLARVAGAGLGLWLADFVLKGIDLAGLHALVLGAFVLGGAHLTVRPLLRLITFPITLLTLGLWLWAQNAALLAAAAWLVPGFTVRGVVPALLGAALISVVAGLTHQIVRDDSEEA